MSPCPDDDHDARLLIDQLRDAGIDINFNQSPTFAYVHATDTDGTVFQHARDDGDLLAAVVDVAERCGYEFD